MLLSARMYKELHVVFQYLCYAFFHSNSDNDVLTFFAHDDLSHQGQR